MDANQHIETLREHAELTWRLASKAEGEGNVALARDLAQLARETDDRVAKLSVH